MADSPANALPFHFTYRTNKLKGHKIHLVYNVMATFSGHTYNSISESVDLEPFDLDFYATPEKVTGYAPCSHFIVDTERANFAAVENLENILYGSLTSTPRFPSSSELLSLF